MIRNKKEHGKSIAEQILKMRTKYPHFKSEFTSRSSLKITGIIQPTSRSDMYTFLLKYEIRSVPKIEILSPSLHQNSKNKEIPHLYPKENLCLYRPLYKEFSQMDFLCDTIVPWTSLWLYFYEVWHLTGEWLGGGEHPEDSSKE